jgi:DNA-binding HxlR family transcriptional regulator
VSKRYDQYCPVAHALGMVGERWSLLIVRELLQGPKRYTDLATALPPGIGTNILSARLKDLEECGIVTKRRLDPPAASKVYELTAYGYGLKGVLRALALWGLQTIGPPTPDAELAPGWLFGAVDTALAPVAPPGAFEFRIEGEVASLVDGEPKRGPAENPDVVLTADFEPFYWLVVERRWDEVTVDGDRELLQRLLDAAFETAPVPAEPALI